MYMNIGSFLVKVKRYIGSFLLFQFNGQVVHTVYLCLPQAVRQTESLNGRQVGLIMTQRTTIMRTSGQTFSTCLGTFQRMVFSRNSAWRKVIMETVAAKFGPKENTAFIRKVIEFFKIPEQSYPYVSHHVSNCSESKQYFSLNLITYDQAVVLFLGS